MSDEQKKIKLVRGRNGQIAVASTATAAALVFAVAPEAKAQDAATQVTSMITSLSGIASAALVVALVPMSVSFAFKIVRRVMN